MRAEARRRGEEVRGIEQVSGDVVDLAYRLHRDLGPGLLESVYEAVMAAKLAKMAYDVVRQQPVDIEYDDFLVDRRLAVEIKSVERLNAAHGKQLLIYLRLTKQPVGLLINFGGATLKEGLHRVVNDYTPSASPRRHANKI